MNTYTQIVYQIVFGTRNREHTLVGPNKEELYKYITGILKNKNCFLYIINGVEDHIHIVTHIHPSVALASLVKDIKMASTEYIKQEKLFPRFNGWQNGYGAFTYTQKEIKRLIEYVKNQEQHHARKTFFEEYREFLKEHEIQFEEKYLL